MDEVFLVGGGKCPRCQGKTAGQLFAQAVNDLHRHLAKKDVAMLMWADRLLDAARFSYGNWEASRTGSHTALSQIPKDIILCDWHYGQRQDYPSVRFFQQQGFRVLPATWNNPEAAVALIRNANREATDKMLGFLFTGWSAGGNGEYLLAGLKETKPVAGKPSRQQTGRQIAATLRLGVKELDRLAQPPRKEK
jgi:hypothetical protein